MINASELRIGNIAVDYLGHEVDISIRDFGVEADTTCEFKDWIPIPLTEEWLLKFDAEIREQADDDFLKIYDLKGWKISLNKDNRFSFWYAGIYIDYLEVKSVHQLQNLYFALTGEELKIKESFYS